MRKSSSGQVFEKPVVSQKESGRWPSILTIIVIFCLGLAGGGYFLTSRNKSTQNPTGAVSTDGKLSESTLSVLKDLKTPLSIRFYNILDPVSTTSETREFATRTSYLLSTYQSESGGMIKVVRYNSFKDITQNKALADGVRAFNQDKGEACILGIVVEGKEQKETLPQLMPQWEAALEADITRAIIKAASTKPVSRGTPVTSKNNPALVEDVKRLLPDVSNLSVAEGSRILKEKAMVELEKIKAQMDAELKVAEENFAKAKSSGSESGQSSASKEIMAIRNAGNDKIRKLAMRLQDQISTLEEMKKK